MRNLEYPITLRTLVRRFLTALASRESDAERLKREERELRARIALQRRQPPVTRGHAQALCVTHGGEVEGMIIINPSRWGDAVSE